MSENSGRKVGSCHCLTPTPMRPQNVLHAKTFEGKKTEKKTEEEKTLVTRKRTLLRKTDSNGRYSKAESVITNKPSFLRIFTKETRHGTRARKKQT